MNIFFLSMCPVEAAQSMCDKHVVKMITEGVQMLSTAHHVLDVDSKILPHIYKKTHSNHPCNIWIRENSSNYNWLVNHTLALSEEYTKRYNKIHKSSLILKEFLLKPPVNITETEDISSPPQCVPDQYKSDDIVESYRKYYNNDKIHFAKYKLNNKPHWLKENNIV